MGGASERLAHPSDLAYYGFRQSNSSGRHDGSEAGTNPALSRNCVSPPEGISQVACVTPVRMRPSEEGRFGRPAPAAGPSPSATQAEVFL